MCTGPDSCQHQMTICGCWHESGPIHFPMGCIRWIRGSRFGPSRRRVPHPEPVCLPSRHDARGKAGRGGACQANRAQLYSTPHTIIVPRPGAARAVKLRAQVGLLLLAVPGAHVPKLNARQQLPPRALRQATAACVCVCVLCPRCKAQCGVCAHVRVTGGVPWRP